jgi:hypothetical protein
MRPQPSNRAHLTIPDRPRILIRGSSGDGLSQWASLYIDLDFVRRTVKRLLALPQMSPAIVDESDVQKVALWNAAVVAYGRSFGTGQRWTVGRRLLAELDRRELAVHKRIIATRDSHVAHHSHKNDAEKIEAWIAINMDDPAVWLFDIELLGDKLSGPTHAYLRTITSLVDKLATRALEERHAAVAAIQEMVKELPEADLNAAVRRGTIRMDSKPRKEQA